MMTEMYQITQIVTTTFIMIIITFSIISNIAIIIIVTITIAIFATSYL